MPRPSIPIEQITADRYARAAHPPVDEVVALARLDGTTTRLVRIEQTIMRMEARLDQIIALLDGADHR